jgi:hypothetical protein
MAKHFHPGIRRRCLIIHRCVDEEGVPESAFGVKKPRNTGEIAEQGLRPNKRLARS